MPPYVNTVPQGRIGTGNAQVFGDNPVAAQFGNQLAALRRKQELDAQKLAQAWRDNQLAASSGRLWASDMAAIEKDFIDRGIKLQQRGVNPYGSSPEAMEYQRDKRYVEAQQGYRKAVEARLNDALTKVNANPNKYDPRSIQSLNDFFAKTKLSDAFASNMDIPQLTERFDVGEYLQPFKALTDEVELVENGVKINKKTLNEPGTQNMLLGALARDPRGRQYINEMTSGFSVPDIQQFAPTYEANLKMVTDYVKGNPNERKRLAAQGILPDTPLMEEYISDVAQAHTMAKKKFDSDLKNLVSASATGLDLFDKQTPVKEDLSRETLDERIRHNRAMEAKKAAGSDSGGTSDPPKDLQFFYGQTKDGKRPSFTGKGTVSLNSPTMNMHGTNVIDAATGKPVKIADPSNDFALVSMTHVPIIGKGLKLSGAIAQDDFVEDNPDRIEYKKMAVVQKPRGGGKFSTYYIDADLVPTNTFSKKTQAEYDRFMRQPTPQTSQAAPTKTASVSQIKALVGKPGYEGYTEKELIDYYKSQGYTVK